ncbi:GNAT family N-acetyltransferase [Agromyces sp. H66]|uniref:GNAT family N-acetyltransferase n=1 Tax=Agromyces sp. H66 TaxID=2529859 RepID=UPI0010AB0DB1|nr:GNAT family N-acetyltransferase [Agromyces sp. H66]
MTERSATSVPAGRDASLRDRLRHALAWLSKHSPVRRPGWMRGPAVPDGVRSPTIATERLVLRPHRLRDAAAWYALQSDPEVLRYLAWPPRSRLRSFKHLIDRTHHVDLLRKDDFLALAVMLDGKLIGDVSMHFRATELPDRQFEIGWIIATDQQGHGYARESADGMLGLAFDRMRAKRVIAKIWSQNEASRVLATRLGFVEISNSDDERVMALDVDGYRASHGRGRS